MRLRELIKLVEQISTGGGGGGGVTYDWASLPGGEPVDLPTWDYPEYDDATGTFLTTINFADLTAIPEWPGPCLVRVNIPPLASGQLVNLFLSPADGEFTLVVIHVEGVTDRVTYEHVLVPEGSRLRMSVTGGTPYFPLLCVPLA